MRGLAFVNPYEPYAGRVKPMIKKLVLSALFAGFTAGLIAAALQQTLVIPVLLEAELYETGELVHFGGAGNGNGALTHDHASHDHDPGEPQDRALLTWLSTTATTIGFALIIAACMAFAERGGHSITARSGIFWGAAAFLAFQFMPAISHPPELPGNAAADLSGRQIWWVFCVVATAIGLACLAFGNHIGFWAAGIVAIAAPHLIGAPHPTQLAGVAPPEIAALFATRALGAGLISFVALGALLGHFWASEGSIWADEI